MATPKNEYEAAVMLTNVLARIADHMASIRESLAIIARNSNHSPLVSGVENIVDAIDRQGPNTHRKRER